MNRAPQTTTAPAYGNPQNGAGPAAYRLQAVTTASPAQLVVMLFDRAIAAVLTSNQALSAGGVQNNETGPFRVDEGPGHPDRAHCLVGS